MFNSLVGFWRGKDFLSRVLDDFKQMLDKAEQMFVEVSDALLEGKVASDLKQGIYGIDKEINHLERSIRKRIVEHVALQPGENPTVCLCLMSVVKDAERLGDYTKNLYEVIELLQKPIDRQVFDSYFHDMPTSLLTLFKDTKDAFVQEDERKVESTYVLERKLVRECDEILEKLATSDLSTNEAVCYALIARYFKRVAAHLVNISTSVTVPISDLDYFDEKRLEDPK